jgi:anti-sigma factor RsiW
MSQSNVRSSRTGDCRKRLAALFLYLDGELSPGRCRMLERHLAACGCCAALSRELRRTILVCRAAGRAPASAAVRARARARVRRFLHTVQAPESTRGRQRSGAGRTGRP